MAAPAHGLLWAQSRNAPRFAATRVNLGVDDPRSDTVDANPFVGDLSGEPDGQAVQRRFRRRVIDVLTRCTEDGRARGDVDDRSPTATVPRRHPADCLAFVCAREAVRRMSTRHGGRGGAIVNVSSRAAVLGAPGEYVDYAASKAALDGLTVGLAREVADEGIRVNGVRAGIIDTEIHASGGEPGRVARLGPQLPMGRGGHAIEVARAILWLLSDEASYTTGTFIDVAGGR